MPRKSPYDHNERYTLETNQIADEFHQAIQSVFYKYVEKGYAVRQLSHIAISEVWDCELLAMLDMGKNLRATIEGEVAAATNTPPEVPVPGPGRQRTGDNILPPKKPLPIPKRARKDVP